MKKKIFIIIIAFLLGFLACKLTTFETKKNLEKKSDLNDISEVEFSQIVKKLFRFMDIMKNEMENLDGDKN